MNSETQPSLSDGVPKDRYGRPMTGGCTATAADTITEPSLSLTQRCWVQEVTETRTGDGDGPLFRVNAVGIGAWPDTHFRVRYLTADVVRSW